MSRTALMTGVLAAATVFSVGCNNNADHAADELKDAKKDVVAQQKDVNEAQATLRTQQAQLDSAHTAADSARIQLNRTIRRDTTIRP